MARRLHTPGGSSGGSGAAVASGLVLAALGTDTLGSVRLPAAYCGIVGLKATMGLISTRGVVPLSHSLDHIGLLCRSVRDSSLLLALLVGEDIGRAGSVAAPSGWSPEPQTRDSLQGLRIGVLDQAWTADLTEEVAAGFTRAEKVLQDLGAVLVPLSLQELAPYTLQRPALLVIEAEGADALAEPLRRTPDAFSDGLKSMLAYGRDAPARRLVRAQHLLVEAGLAVRQALEGVDLDYLADRSADRFFFYRRGACQPSQPDHVGKYLGLPGHHFALRCRAVGVAIGATTHLSPVRRGQTSRRCSNT